MLINLVLNTITRRILRLEVARIRTRTAKQHADLQIKRTNLLCRIQRWREIQISYMSGLASMIQPLPSSSLNLNENGADHESLPVENLPLWLPSSLMPELRETSSMRDISLKECRLRIAQADDSLADIRRHRRIIAGLYQFKRLNVSGTGNKPNTRMRTLFNRFNNRTLRCAERYRAAYAALLCLDPHGSWTTRLQRLDAKDIRGPGKEDDEPSNGRFVPSWIWLAPRVPSAPDLGDSEAQLDDSMRVEWVKSKARLSRWEEEVQLVEEEMRRVVEYLKWKAGWWRNQRDWGVQGDSTVRLGISAYAEKQAALLTQLATSCAEAWLPVLHKCGIVPGWGELYIINMTDTVPPSEALVAGQSADSGTDWNEDNDDDEEDEEIDDVLSLAVDSEDVEVDFFEDDD